MKILQASKLYYPWVGGVERVVEDIAAGLNNKAGFEIKVLCCQPKGKGRIEEINGVKVYKASSWGMFLAMPFSFAFFNLYKNLAKDCDLIALHHPFPLGFLAYLLFKPKARLVVHYHSDIVRQKFTGFLFSPFIYKVLKEAQKIIVSNPNLIKSSPYLKRFKDKCAVIPHGVDLVKIGGALNKNEVKEIKERYGDFILFAGRFSYYKGLQYLIEAVKDIQINLLIIGEGQAKRFLKRKVKNLKIENRVFFLPPQAMHNLINFYQACRIFVLPSIYKSEAFGLVLLEAMACGKPVISTELGTGTSFVNQDGVTGYVVPPKNSRALAEAIKKILEAEELAGEFGQNARQRVSEEFSLEKMLKGISSCYTISSYAPAA